MTVEHDAGVSFGDVYVADNASSAHAVVRFFRWCASGGECTIGQTCGDVWDLQTRSHQRCESACGSRGFFLGPVSVMVIGFNVIVHEVREAARLNVADLIGTSGFDIKHRKLPLGTYFVFSYFYFN